MAKIRENKFKAKREELGLTQQAAAHELGVAIATWCRWESGISNPLPEHRRRLELLYYRFHPSESPKACAQADTMSLNSGEFQQHLTTCEQCKLRIEFLHNEMDFM
jgi:transcriptional regulator with XRE-family HTH domain